MEGAEPQTRSGDGDGADAVVDVEANARVLEQLLALADQLPQRSEAELQCPVFRDLAV